MEILIAVVTGSRTDLNREGTAAGRLLQVVLSDDQDVQTVEMCQQGEEYHPVPGTRVAVVQGGSAYKLAMQVDDGVEPVMLPGGKRIYSTDQTGEAVTAEIRLHPSGQIQVFNGEVAMTLEPTGAASIANDNGGATLSPSGAWTFHGTSSHFDHPVTVAGTLSATGAVSSDITVTAPLIEGTTDVTFAGKSTLTHAHLSDGPGSSTGPPL